MTPKDETPRQGRRELNGSPDESQGDKMSFRYKAAHAVDNAIVNVAQAVSRKAYETTISALDRRITRLEKTRDSFFDGAPVGFSLTERGTAVVESMDEQTA